MIDKITNIVDKSSVALFGIAATCGTIMCFRIQLSDIGINFSDSQYSYIAIGFLLSSFVLVARVVTITYKKWDQHRAFIKVIRNLTRDETSIVIEFIERQCASQSFHPGSGAVGGLVAKGVIYRASNLGHPRTFLFSYNIQPWVRDYIKYNSHILSSIKKL